MIRLRRATRLDAPAVAEVFLRSFHATYDFPLAHTDDEVREWVRTRLVPQMETWVAAEDDGPNAGDDAARHAAAARRGAPANVVGFMTVAPGWLEQLYVDPRRLGEGIGRRLLDLAKERQPEGLLLWTFQVNDRARRFYERNGFTAVRFGDESNNEERQPDVQYEWRPPGRPSAGRQSA